MLFIPDISGFTELVHSVDVLTGKQITYELLSAVMSQNLLNLNVSEVEGDAVLFYRYGPVPTVNELMQQYSAMMKAFEAKRAALEESLGHSLHLALKIIAHYGAITEYQIGPFKKLYGEVVVDAHRLLKNAIQSNSYLLLTDALLQQSTLHENEAQTANKLCEVSGNRSLCFSYFDFAKEELQRVA